MPTFSSVVHKPGRKVAAPRVVPRRNVRNPGPTATAATAELAQSSQPNLNGVEAQATENASEATQPTTSTVAHVTRSRDIAVAKQQPQEQATLASQFEDTNEPPVILSTPSVPTATSTALEQHAPSRLSVAAAESQRLGDRTQKIGQVQFTKNVPASLAGRKRKAAELVSTQTDQSRNQTPDISLKDSSNSAGEGSSTVSHTTADVPVPSIESGSATELAAKPRRAAPKPRPQPRIRKAALPSTEAADAQSRIAAEQQIRRSQASRSATSRPPSASQSEADALLQNVTSQFTAVSRLADGIDGTSRTSIPATSDSNQPSSERSVSSLANALNRAAHRQNQNRSAADLANEIINEAVGSEVLEKPKRKRRKRTPEDAEDHVIDPTETKMGDLTRATGLGKKSGIEIALENVDWKAVKQQQKEMAEETAKQQEIEKQEKRSGKPKKRKKVQGERHDEALVPQMAVVNGVIVSVAESREIDIRRDAEAEAAREDANVITVDKLTQRKNQNTIGKAKGLQGKQLQWTEEMDERFYKGIRMFGTDMLMLCSLFPKMERGHVKRKFVREERANPERLREALFNPISVDDKTYTEETGLELGDPKKLEEELKAMEADLRKRFEATMAEQQAGAHHPPIEIDDADIPLPSLEGTGAELEETLGTQAGPANRFNAVADDIINDVLGGPRASKKGKKKTAGPGALASTGATGAGAGGRKKKDGSAAAAAPRKGSKAAKQAAALQQLGGTVEAIGTVDE